MITAKSIGSTSVIVSNEDTTILVNIIVNEVGNGTTEQNTHDTDMSKIKDITDELTKQIKESNDNMVKVSGISKISSSALRELYGTNKTLTVMFDEYDLSIRGQDILKLLSKLYYVSINILLVSPVKLVCQCCGMPLEDSSISKGLLYKQKSFQKWKLFFIGHISIWRSAISFQGG